MSLVAKVIGNMSSGGQKVRSLTPLGIMGSVDKLPETRQIHHLAKLPALKSCNESRALEYADKAAEANMQLGFMKRISDSQKRRMDTARDAIKTRLDLRQHGLKTAAAIAQTGANHRIAGLQAGYLMQEAATVVSASERVASRSAELIQW